MTIISASYKTDIPAFYGEWFENRIKAGYVDVRNPFNNRLSRISLHPDDIEGFVFWTRNIGPFLPRLEKLIGDRFPFYVQYTITGYPRLLENSVPDREISLERFKEIVSRYGPRSAIWRYDPVVISSVTPENFHLETFEHLSSELRGATDEVVVSFVQFYRKTKKNLATLKKTEDLSVFDPTLAQKKTLLAKLRDIAARNDQKLTLCTQPDLVTDAISGAACIDSARLGLERRKVQGNRKGCLCAAARDIGAYDTCPHGCVYCYAVSKSEKAKHFAKTGSPFSGELRLPDQAV